MPKSLKFHRYLLVALLVATTYAETDNDVPGCACQADTTCGTTEMFSDTLACSLIQRSDSPYQFQDVFEQPVAICDGLEADPEFQEAVGNESRPYYFNGGGESIGPYYDTGFVAVQVAYGTCEDVIAKQNSCPVATGSNEDDGLFAEFNTGNAYSKAVLETGMDSGDLDLCKSDVAAEYPALTRTDWIEPKAGSSRRYMRHDIVDVDGTEYCLLALSIGNEPCRGPPPASSSHTTNGRHAVLFVLAGQLAFAVLSWVL